MAVKVNLGCGPVGKVGWVNIDWGILAFLHRYCLIEKFLLKLNLFPKGYNVQWPRNLRLHDCRKRLPFPDNSIDYIYASHFLEHFKKFEAERIIKDCYRALKSEGIIRVAVPDVELLARKYLERDTNYFKKVYALMNFGEQYLEADDALLVDIVIDNFYPYYYRRKPQGMQKILVCFVRPHFWMYDTASLSALLRNAGFKEVHRKDFREGAVPDLEHLDVFPEMSLYMEAQK